MNIKDIEIQIPSTGRGNRQRLFESLPQKWRDRAKIWVRNGEKGYEQWKDSVTRYPMQPHIGAIREEMLKRAQARYVFQLDDDIRILQRVGKKFSSMETKSWDRLFEMLCAKLDEGYVLVGLNARFMAHTLGEKYWHFGARTIAFHGLIPANIPDGIRYDAVSLNEDIHFDLACLEQGHKVGTTSHFVHDQRPGAEGGCNTYRTNKLVVEQAKKLAQLHPKTVKMTINKAGKEVKRVMWARAKAMGGFT